MAKSNIFKIISAWWGGVQTPHPSYQTIITDNQVAQQNISAQQVYNAQSQLSQQQMLGAQNQIHHYKLGNNLSGYLNYPSTYGNLKKLQEDSIIKCENLKKDIDKLDNIVKTILEDIKSDICTSYSLYPLTSDEVQLEKTLKVGIIIQEHIRKYEFSQKMEKIINE